MNDFTCRILSLIKTAKSLELRQLLEAKKRSDKNDYAGKNEILSALLKKHPEQFSVDQILNNKYVGITHKPSGFQIHTSRALIPTGIEHNYTSKKT
jgi:hypothetical protein